MKAKNPDSIEWEMNIGMFYVHECGMDAEIFPLLCLRSTVRCCGKNSTIQHCAYLDGTYALCYVLDTVNVLMFIRYLRSRTPISMNA